MADTKPDRLRKLPEDLETCSIEELAMPVSGSLISRPTYSAGGNLLTGEEQLRQQRQMNKKLFQRKKQGANHEDR